MGKVKTHKASAKRFKVTGSGRVKMTHCHRRHNTGNKSGNKLRHLRVAHTSTRLWPTTSRA